MIIDHSAAYGSLGLSATRIAVIHLESRLSVSLHARLKLASLGLRVELPASIRSNHAPSPNSAEPSAFVVVLLCFRAWSLPTCQRRSSLVERAGDCVTPYFTTFAATSRVGRGSHVLK